MTLVNLGSHLPSAYQLTLYPNMGAEVSILDTLRRTLGRILYRLNESSFSRKLAASRQYRETSYMPEEPTLPCPLLLH